MRPEHFRFKTAEPGNNKEWQCCICLHVRTATIMFGLWHMLLHILAMTIMVALLNNPSLIIAGAGANGEMAVGPPRSMPTQKQVLLEKPINIRENDLADLENEQFELNKRLRELGPTHRPDYEVIRKQLTRYADIQSSILITFFTMLMTMALVMGALRGKPTLLMPFFCFQLFDFCLGVLAGFSYLAKLPDVHHLVTNSKNLPFQNALLQMNPQCLAFVMVVSFALAMTIKGYFIRVVWKCYKFLVLKATTRHTIHVIDTSPSYDSQNLLPDYEAALAKYASPPPHHAAGPPPSYDLATAAATVPFAPPPSYLMAVANTGAPAGACVVLPVEQPSAAPSTCNTTGANTVTHSG
uniref:Lysosomal-associated transmembrane protein 4A n=1 Tax=Cacopsylla melanoneura TaxID=428564 RepID=A0A8D8LI27_9HEMI